MVSDAASVLHEMRVNRLNGYVGSLFGGQCTELLLLEQLAGVGIVCCRNMRDETSCCLASSFCLDCSILKKKAIWSPETSEYAFPTTRRNILEELNLQQRWCVDLRPLSEASVQ